MSAKSVLLPAQPLYRAEDFVSQESWIFIMNQVRARFVCTLDAELARHDTTAAQWGILKLVADGRGSTAAEFCRIYDYDTGSMTRMLDRLEEKGLIQRERSSQDRRLVHVVLTDAGTELSAVGQTTMVQVLNDYLRGFDADELEILKALLRRLLANSDA